MRYLGFMLVLLFFFGCKEPEPRRPVQVKSKSFFKESVERSKKLLAKEQVLIKDIIKNDSTQEYFNSPYGFHYFYEVENPNNTYQLKTNDEVVFTYTIMTLNNDTIYSAEEIGMVQHAIDKSQLFPGLRNGIKIMKVPEKITFLFPSSQGYGYKGDGNRIGPSTPLKTSVQLLKITKNKDSLNKN
ncbi:gliding motility-associated peptidyl-prolyl isomerase GldI [Croceitalea sp. MTPC9]|uniref:gliding motility-associated peptidyl-prolyl isomerase GldI n=1 Tax=unclassified Croceitalea TaxID=2632280 RepID=UPI002B3E81FE|nr:gliding motility-associated peptidyl-prolyl isomerase GldI [Croceitalea sp. MTPC6]GMN15247.1 gliding motility-associated peptidyl-prolyl isomerase GldI [Croceitalea sp. MTPC9]